jgi:osmotically inducible protein OsmC
MSKLSAPPTSLLDVYTGSEILPLYSTSVTVTGGEAGHGRASGRAQSDDGALDLPLRLPAALGGPGGATNPEQLFAAGYAACFHGAISLVAAKKKIRLTPGLAVKVNVSFGRDPSDGLFLLTAEVQVSLPDMEAAQARELVQETEKICPYAKMARQGIHHSVVLA